MKSTIVLRFAWIRASAPAEASSASRGTAAPSRASCQTSSPPTPNHVQNPIHNEGVLVGNRLCLFPLLAPTSLRVSCPAGACSSGVGQSFGGRWIALGEPADESQCLLPLGLGHWGIDIGLELFRREPATREPHCRLDRPRGGKATVFMGSSCCCPRTRQPPAGRRVEPVRVTSCTGRRL